MNCHFENGKFTEKELAKAIMKLFKKAEDSTEEQGAP